MKIAITALRLAQEFAQQTPVIVVSNE